MLNEFNYEHEIEKQVYKEELNKLKNDFDKLSDNEKVKKVYDELRNNVIEAVHSSWKDTHTFYEQYEDGTGKGTKNRPFNGWTSLIVEIISEQY